MDWRLRRATAADLDAVEALENRVFTSDKLSRGSLRSSIAAPSACFLVLEAGGDIVGDAIVAFRRRSAAARLYSIAVDPGSVGRGLGHALLQASEQAVRDRGGLRLRLEVRSDNAAAIRFYERSGYRRFGDYPDYYEDGATAFRYERVVA